MEPAETDHALLQRLEESLLRPDTRSDSSCVEKLLAPDFFEFGRSGREHSRETCVAAGLPPVQVQLPLLDFVVRLLAADVALVTYTSVVTDQGILQRSRRSSVWSRTPDGWVMRFHQGTPCE